jgi:hypothetical protein
MFVLALQIKIARGPTHSKLRGSSLKVFSKKQKSLCEIAHHGKIYLGRYSFSNVGPIDTENMGRE